MVFQAGKKAVSLLQVLIVIAIMIILAALIIPAAKTVGPKVSKARCMNNMRQLHIAFSNYLTDVGRWPQIPPTMTNSEKAYSNWWLDTLEPFGASKKIWLCPILSRAKHQDAEGKLTILHYIPTQFDANPISPHRWPGQPWLIERGDAHGDGALIMFPDGSIQSLAQVLKKKR